MVYRHTGYPGGIKSETYAELLARKPADAVRRSVRGMLPKGPLGRQMLTKLKVYAGPDHPHAAQTPEPLDLAARQAPAEPGDERHGHAPLTQTTGRRKEAVARARLRPGTGEITINGRAVRGLLPDAGAPDGRHRAAARHRDRRGATTSTPRSTAAASAARPARCAWHRPLARRARPRDPCRR